MQLPIRALKSKLAKYKPKPVEHTRSEITAKLEAAGLCAVRVWDALRIGRLSFPATASLQNVAELDAAEQKRLYPGVVQFIAEMQA